MADDRQEAAKVRLEQLQNELSEKRRKLAEVNQARLDKVEARKKLMAERAAARGERAAAGSPTALRTERSYTPTARTDTESPTQPRTSAVTSSALSSTGAGGSSPSSASPTAAGSTSLGVESATTRASARAGGTSELSSTVRTITSQVTERAGRRDLPPTLATRRQRTEAAKMTQENFTLFSTPPIEKERYAKAAQTDEPYPEKPKESDTSYSSPATTSYSSYSSPPPTSSYSPPSDSSGGGGGGGGGESFSDTVARIQGQVDGMTTADRKRMQATPEFYEFISRTSLIMERALNLHIDVILEPTSTDDTGKLELGDRMSKRETFFDDKWSRNKPVTSLAINSKNPEFFLASYVSRKDVHATKSCGSCVLVWSKHLPQRFYAHYTCESDISNAFYCKYRPNMIIGSTYTGQVILWDTRSGPDPVVRSPVSAETHTHVIFGATVVGTSNAHCLVTLSTDGRFCTWGLDNMSQPQECIDLCQLVDIGESRVKRDITATTLNFGEQEMNKFFVGSEDGGLYAGNRHGSSSHISEKYEGHMGPITATHCHPNTGGGADFTDLILTSSMDWTCKLWSVKKNKPLASFDEFQEYVYDIKWSPIHPSLFACADGKGVLSLWNLSQTMDIPVSKLEVADGNALNKLVWSPDGRSIITGDSKGNLVLSDVMAEAAVPGLEDWDKLDSRVSSLK